MTWGPLLPEPVPYRICRCGQFMYSMRASLRHRCRHARLLAKRSLLALLRGV